LKLNKQLVLLSLLKSDAQSATHTVAVSSVVGLVTFDAATATQVIYSA
jgi:hypothetical protein